MVSPYLSYVQESHPQGKLTEMRVEECEKSESRPVMGQIEAEPKGNIASRESGQTSTRSLITRKLDKPIKEEKQMTVEQTGASSHLVEGWHDIDWKAALRNVRRLQARIVKATEEGKWGKVKALQHLLTRSFWRGLSRMKGALSRPVLRGPGGSNASSAYPI